MLHTDGIIKTLPYTKFYFTIAEIGAFTETSIPEGEQ